MMFCSGKLLPEASAASPSATPPKTIRPIKGKPSRCMVSSQQSANKSDRERAQLLSHPATVLIKLVTIDGCAHIVGAKPLLPRNAKLHQDFLENFSRERWLR